MKRSCCLCLGLQDDYWPSYSRQPQRHALLAWYGQQIFGPYLTHATWRWLQRLTPTLLTRSQQCLRAEVAARTRMTIEPTLKAGGAVAPGDTAKAPAAQPEAERTGDLPHLSERPHGAAWRNLVRSHPGVERQPNATAAAASLQLALHKRQRPRHQLHHRSLIACYGD